MGACASVEKGEDGEPGTKLGFFKLGAKADRAIVLPEPPPFKETKPVAVDFLVKSFDDFGGSKNETFFDSRPWLDSDCDDDFFSVNGDFTPSRGNTPVHHKFATVTPQVHNASVAEGVFGYAASPTGKKRLSELFRESIREKHGIDEPQAPGRHNLPNGNAAAIETILDVLPRSSQCTTHISGPNYTPGSERTTNLDRVETDMSMKLGQCCLPSLMPSRSLTERKKRLSPTVTVGGKA